MTREQKEFTENKLLLLYILREVGFPLTNLQISRIVWEFEFMNYFDMQQCLYELSESAMVDYFKQAHGLFYDITSLGIEALELFENRIRLSFRRKVSQYAAEKREMLKKETQFTSIFKKEGDTHYIVTCNVIENDKTIFSMNIDVPTHEQAKMICEKWESGAADIYKFTMESLMS